ncbi:MAG: type II secretion system protein [Bacteroidetes bacterium]|nr:type II secretion system protein [Bacteroidota bacterium]
MLVKIVSVSHSKLRAFTLQELLIVLIIVGILVLLALPNLMPLISKTKATEAKLQLKHLYTLEKNYFYMHSKYSSDLNNLDFQQEKLTTEDGQANYIMEIIDAGTNNFLARATAVVDFDGDGTYNVWEINQDNQLKEITKD